MNKAKHIISFHFRKYAKGIKLIFCKYVLSKPFYYDIKTSQLIANFFFQRILRINANVPTSTHYTSKIDGYSRIIFSDDTHSIKKSFALSGGCYICVMNGTTLEIGEKTIWAFNVCIQTGNHDLLDRNRYNVASIKIGKNCWIGNSVAILAGVEIGDNVTIGSNSVVTKSFPSNVVIAGVPAKIIKQL